MIDLDKLAGFGQTEEHRALYELAQAVPPEHAIVEIGTYKGAGTVSLAAGAATGEGAHVYTVDPADLPGTRHPTPHNRMLGDLDYTDPAIPRIARQQVHDAGLTSQVSFIRGFSEPVGQDWDEPPVALLFIDGDHREGAVRRDYSAWEHALTRDATIAFDDHSPRCPGVVDTVTRLVDKGILTQPWLVGQLAITTRR